jgi:hypothetical protein
VSAAPAGSRSPGAAAWARVRAWLPWLVAAAILAALAARLPRAEIARALATGPFWRVALCSAAVAVAAFAADAWATRAAFAATGVRCPWRGVLLARGATYLLGLLNSVAGQGGMGVYLHRAGVGPLRAAGTVLFLIGTQLAALATVAAAGVTADAATGAGATAATAATTAAAVPRVAHSLPLLGALAAGFALYLLLVAWRPRWLTRREVLAPIFAAGGRGFLRATVARLPQMVVMIAGLWLGLRLWGIPLPLGRGLAVISVVVLVMVLPVAPSGIGTMELAVVELAAPYAPAAVPASTASGRAGAPATSATVAMVSTSTTAGASVASKANVLACTLVYHLGSVVVQGLLGLVCLALLPRQRAGTAGCDVAPLPAAAALDGAPPARAGG